MFPSVVSVVTGFAAYFLEIVVETCEPQMQNIVLSRTDRWAVLLCQNLLQRSVRSNEGNEANVCI